MANKISVVDAVSSCPVPPAGGQTVPVKVDTSGMAKMLQQMVESQMAVASQTPQTLNPADFIRDSGTRMTEIYKRYDRLLELGAQLNGKLVSDKLPDTLAIDDVAITFRVKSGDTFGEPVVASIKNIVCVGDLSTLISSEMGIIILMLQREITSVLDIAKQSEAQYTKARKSWEENNKDRQIREVNPDQPVVQGENEKSSV
jgi:hypothetical protein